MAVYNLENSNALLLYKVGPVLVCSPTLPVESVVLPPHLTTMPGASEAEPGVFKSLYGMVRVVDLRVRFGVDRADRKSPGQIVIAEVAGGHAGFWVDRIEDVATFPERGWSQLPSHVPKQVFGRALLQGDDIRLYADFENLYKFKSSGYLRHHIELLKKNEIKEKEKSQSRTIERFNNKSNSLASMPGVKDRQADNNSNDKKLNAAPVGAPEAEQLHNKKITGYAAETAPFRKNEINESFKPLAEKNATQQIIQSSGKQFNSKAKAADKPFAQVKNTADDKERQRPIYHSVLNQSDASVKNTGEENKTITADTRPNASQVTHADESDSGGSVFWWGLAAFILMLAAGLYYLQQSLFVPETEFKNAVVFNDRVSDNSHKLSQEIWSDMDLAIDDEMDSEGAEYHLNSATSDDDLSVEIEANNTGVTIVIHDYEDAPDEEQSQTGPVSLPEQREETIKDIPRVQLATAAEKEMADVKPLDMPVDAAIAADNLIQESEVAGMTMQEKTTDDAKNYVMSEQAQVPLKSVTEQSDETLQTEQAIGPSRLSSEQQAMNATQDNGRHDVVEQVKSTTHIHVVVKGDTLWDIAERYVNNPWRYPELAKLSKIKNPDLIYPGQRVTIILNHKAP